MLIKTLWNTTAKTDDEYKEILTGRIRLWLLLGLVGLATLIVGIIAGLGAVGHQSSFLSGLYTGIGFAFLAISIARVLGTKKILKDELKIRQMRLKAQDERTILISQKALSMTAVILLITMYIGMLVMGFIDLIIFWILWSLIMCFTVVYLLVRVYYEKKL